MSVLPRTFIVGKRCLFYCGDERCNCDLSPYYRGNNQIGVSRDTLDKFKRLMNEHILKENLSKKSSI